MSAIIEIKDLTKRYNGHPAVDRLNLQVHEGDIFGFVGPNGAGKTSTIRIMATLLNPTHGDILVGGHSVLTAPHQVRRMIGYMPDFFGVYNDMLVWEYLDFFGAAYDIPSQQRSAIINDLLELVDLTHRHSDPCEGLSRGMKQRLSLARTLIHDPQVLILDEPASGLDPRARIEIRELLVELSRMGKTVFFSTHILADVAEICTRVGIIEAGSLVASGTLEELHQHLLPQRIVHISVLERSEQALALLQTLPGVLSVEREPGSQNSASAQIEMVFQGEDASLSELLSALLKADIPVVNFNEDRRDMESLFLRATKGQVT